MELKMLNIPVYLSMSYFTASTVKITGIKGISSTTISFPYLPPKYREIKMHLTGPPALYCLKLILCTLLTWLATSVWLNFISVEHSLHLNHKHKQLFIVNTSTIILLITIYLSHGYHQSRSE